MSTSQAKEEGEEDEILAELAKKQTELKSVVAQLGQNFILLPLLLSLCSVGSTHT